MVLLLVSLTILVIFLPGFFFFGLAQRYNRFKWGYAVFGVLLSFVSMVVFRVAIILAMMTFIKPMQDVTNIMWLISTTFHDQLMPGFAVIVCYFVYRYLEKKWKVVHGRDFSKEENVLDG